MTLVWESGITLQHPDNNDPLLDLNTQPSLDLQFATSKTLDDAVSGTNLITFSRASSGTYVDSDGLIKTSPVNLLTYSNDLSGWSLSNATRAVSSTNPPFGSGNASRFTATSVSIVYPFGGLASSSPSGTYTFSIYTTFTQSFSFLGYGSGFGLLVLFDVDTKQPSTVTVNSGTNATNVNSSVTLDEGGWYKIQVTFTTTGIVSETTVALNKNKTTAWGLFNSSVVGDTLTVFGAQLEEGSTATDYIPTTTTIGGAPRFDHDPVTGESLGLLIEESRTNLFTDSEQFDLGWAKTNLSVSANVSASPDGALNADQVTVTSDNSYAYVRQAKSINSGSTTTLSVWAKYVNSQYIWLLGGVTPDAFAYFDLINGTVGSTNGYNCTITSNGNGWYRCSATITKTGATGVEEIGFGLTRTDNNPTDNAIGDSVYLWGAQLEANASFPTSYIPTSGSTVTRAADLASIEGTNFSSWYNQSEGTLFADASAANAAINQYIFHTYGASPNNNRSAYYLNSSNRPSAAWINNGTTQALLQSATPVSGFEGAAFKYAAAYNTNDFVVGYNGGSFIYRTSGTPDPTINVANIGSFGGSIYVLNGHIARLAYYPYRLADATLQEITS